MEAIKLCRLDTPIIFIEARINLSRFVVTGCAEIGRAVQQECRDRDRMPSSACKKKICLGVCDNPRAAAGGIISKALTNKIPTTFIDKSISKASISSNNLHSFPTRRSSDLWKR